MPDQLDGLKIDPKGERSRDRSIDVDEGSVNTSTTAGGPGAASGVWVVKQQEE